MSRIRVCDICMRDMDDMIFTSNEYVVKRKRVKMGELGFHKMDICDRCMNKIIQYCMESNDCSE